MKYVALCMFFLLTGCGKDGDRSSSDGTEPGSSGVFDNNPRDISGSFFIGDKSKPATGYELLLLDWASGNILSYPITANGSVKVDLKEFVENRTYSFHLVRGDEKVSDIDLSQVNPGLQSGFQYRGGYGFSLGDVVVPVNQFGLLTPPDSGVTANLGGGFSLTGSARDRRLEGLTAAGLTEDLQVEPMLIIPKPDELFYGYLHPLDPAEVAAIKARYDGISVRAFEASEGSIVRIFSSRLSGWQASTRVLPSAFATIQETKSWMSSSYHIERSGTSFSADLLPGLSLAGRILFLRVEGKIPPQRDLPRVMHPGFSRPPVIDALSINAGSMVNVDYGDLDAQNGLIRPFCHDSGSVQIKVSAPHLASGDAATGSYFDHIQLMPEYYTQESGVTKRIDSALAAPYNVDIAEVQSGDYLMSWEAASKSLTFSLSDQVMTHESHVLEVPAGLFPSALAGKVITRVKMRILFKATSHPGKSGSVYLFRKAC